MTVRIELTDAEAVHVQRIIEKGMERIFPESLSEYGVGVVQQIEEQLRMVDQKTQTDDVASFGRWDGSDREPLVDRVFPGLRPAPQVPVIKKHAKIKKAGK